MKVVKVFAWCDHVSHGDEFGAVPEPATEEVLIQLFGKVMQVDLCKQHFVEVEALYYAGTKPPEPLKKPTKGNNGGGQRKRFDKGPQPCPLCDETPPTREALSQHLRTKHDSGFNQLREQNIEIGLLP